MQLSGIEHDMGMPSGWMLDQALGSRRAFHPIQASSQCNELLEHSP